MACWCLLHHSATLVRQVSAVQQRVGGDPNSWALWHAWEALRKSWQILDAEEQSFTIAISAREVIIKAAENAIDSHLSGICGDGTPCEPSGRRRSSFAVVVDRVIAVIRDSKEDLRALQAQEAKVSTPAVCLAAWSPPVTESSR